MALAACGSDDGDGDAGDATTTTAPATTSTAAPGEADATVGVADNEEFGEILVAANGHTLYLFENDDGTTSACTGGCADNWPALEAETPAAGAGVDAAKLTTANGQVPNHVVYNNHLLYFFANDTAPGDVNGASIPAWFPVSPAGDKVESG